MSKKIIIGILLLIVGFAAGYFYPNKRVSLTNMSATSDASYLKGYLPPNPHISANQKFLFENRITASTNPEAVSKYMTVAANTAVESASLAIGPTCQPDKPVIKGYRNENILITNTGSTTQELVIGTETIAVKPGNEGTRLQLSTLYPPNVTVKGISLRSYTCSGVRGPAGFFVLFAD